MLATYRPQFVERVMADQSGRKFRMVFLVEFASGEFKGRLVSVTPISAHAASPIGAGDILCLPILAPKNTTVTVYTPAYAPVVSPYYSAFEFLIHSQPTRAPSRR